MSAAIYARKSTDQSGVSDEQRSVARQIGHARASATRKGWTVRDQHVTSTRDSRAEFEQAARPPAAALGAQALAGIIVSELSRLSRHGRHAQFLKELARAGVRVFCHQDDRAISLETPGDTLVTTINAWNDSRARRESSVRTYEPMARKARAAHVTGGRVFGYPRRVHRGWVNASDYSFP